jgi:hypothetical protein
MNHKLIETVVVTLFAFIGSGCTQFAPYRTRTFIYDGTPEKRIVPDVAECYSGPPQDRRTMPALDKLRPCEDEEKADAAAYAVQHRHYQYKDYENDQDLSGKLRTADYHLSFVEFDDQGWFADRKQMEALFALLDRLETREKKLRNRHVLIILYAHGWKHNASQCDNNVICFSRLLERMDILERHLQDEDTRRQVVGVYVGWRGLSVDAGPLSNITFWTRKSAAERVGRGGVTELLTRLNDYRRIRNAEREGDKTQLVIAGHSFGGQVIYSALSHALMERANRTIRVAAPNCNDVRGSKTYSDGLTCYDTATSFGDFVVLVNPAFEGSQYEPLFHIATNRCYRSDQRPVMMTVTSSGDLATRMAFPLGRNVGTLLERAATSDQADSIVQAVGHNLRYETHKLKWIGGTSSDTDDSLEREDREQLCGCPYLVPTLEFNWRRFKNRIEPFLLPLGARAEENPLTSDRIEQQQTRLYDKEVYGPDVRLEGDVKYSANYPYLVVKTDPEIIPDHNTIYSEPFVRFLHSFFLVHIAFGRPFEADGCEKAKAIEACPNKALVPCEQSCVLPDGRSCSGRSTDGLGSTAGRPNAY